MSCGSTFLRKGFGPDTSNPSSYKEGLTDAQGRRQTRFVVSLLRLLARHEVSYDLNDGDKRGSKDRAIDHLNLLSLIGTRIGPLATGLYGL